MNARTIGIAMSALAILTVTGCASKNVSSTSDGTESGQLSAFKSGLGSKMAAHERTVHTPQGPQARVRWQAALGVAPMASPSRLGPT